MTPKSRYDDDFQAFWKKFRGRWDTDKGAYTKVGKYLAWQEWKRLTGYEKKQAVAVAHRTGGKFTPDACRWLKRKLFEDFS